MPNCHVNSKTQVVPAAGVSVSNVDMTDLDAVRAGIIPGRTKLVLVESPTNPRMQVRWAASLKQTWFETSPGWTLLLVCCVWHAGGKTRRSCHQQVTCQVSWGGSDTDPSRILSAHIPGTVISKPATAITSAVNPR